MQGPGRAAAEHRLQSLGGVTAPTRAPGPVTLMELAGQPRRKSPDSLGRHGGPFVAWWGGMNRTLDLLARQYGLALVFGLSALSTLGCGVGLSHNPRNEAGQGPAAVSLGEATSLAAAGNYAVLAKTGITNAGGSMVTGGSLGLSPAAASYITGFALTADVSNVYATSPSVASPGRVYAADYALPSPVKLTGAILSMELAYADAASRTPADVLDLGGGNLAGKTLAPGLYTFGSGVTIPAEVTFSGGAGDVWILQVANDLDLAAGVRVTLAGGAQASRIFWQVAGQATLHAGSHLEGVVLSKTGITLQTSASLHGRALAQTLVALDDNAITAP